MTRPVLSLTADFPGGSADLTDFGRNDSGVQINRGTQSTVTSGFVADAGTYATTLDNIDRDFDPNNSLSQFAPDIVPGIPLAAQAVWDAVTYDLFTGAVDGWPQSYPLNGKDQAVELRASDAIAAFANGRLAVQRQTEYSGARIQAVVDAIGWPGPTDIRHGDCLITRLRDPTVVSFSHMADVCNAEYGALMVLKDGTLAFWDRDTIANETRSSVSQATYVQSGGFNYSGLTMAELPIVNDATVNFGERGRSQTSQDLTSIGMPWGLRSQTFSLPISTGPAALQYARWQTSRYANPITTFSSVTFTPSNEPGATFDLWAELFERELGDLVSVTVDPLATNSGGAIALSGDPITRDCWIRGISHDFGASGDWQTTFYLQDASWLAGLWHWDVSVWDGPDIFAL